MIFFWIIGGIPQRNSILTMANTDQWKLKNLYAVVNTTHKKLFTLRRIEYLMLTNKNITHYFKGKNSQFTI